MAANSVFRSDNTTNFINSIHRMRDHRYGKYKSDEERRIEERNERMRRRYRR